MNWTFRHFCLATLFTLVPTVRGADEPAMIAGIGPTGPIEKVGSGFYFTEGPVWSGKELYLSDIPRNQVLRLVPGGKVDTLLEKSGMCNGLALDGAGRIIACQGRMGRIIALDPASGRLEPIVESFEGNRFNQPNDLVLDGAGGIYFTDPEFVTKSLPQGTMGVYYVPPPTQAGARAAIRLAEGLDLPNGIGLSPDDKRLYVVQMGARNVLEYTLEAPGKVDEIGGRELVRLDHGGDGMAVDAAGNLYVTQPEVSGIEVVAPDGRRLGLIRFPLAPANCAFGGADGKTLFVTARRSVYAAPMATSGQPAKSPGAFRP